MMRAGTDTSVDTRDVDSNGDGRVPQGVEGQVRPVMFHLWIGFRWTI